MGSCSLRTHVVDFAFAGWCGSLLVCHAACSSAFLALHDAVTDLQRGRVDYAVVGGSSAIFRPATSLAFFRLKYGSQLLRTGAADPSIVTVLFWGRQPFMHHSSGNPSLAQHRS